MVAIIGHSKNIKAVLSYNERKVKTGQAQLISSNLFACNPEELSFSAKLNRFTKRNEKNGRTRTNTLHISLNFDPSEKISDATMREVADSYMNQIGFNNQPYLVYRHLDAAHPHIHLVTTLIDVNGSRINTHNIGRLKSEPARLAIEKQFGLLPAGGRRHAMSMRPARITAAAYGTLPTKAAIDAVVSYVVKEYRFTSMAELNAVLRLFNVGAETGAKDSYLAKTGGIYYRILTDDNKTIGVPIKASAVPGRPTLKKLQRQFEINKVLRKRHKERLVRSLSQTVGRIDACSPGQLQKLLAKWNISMACHFSAGGRSYGVTYIDHGSRCIFKGSDLGKSFSANALAEKFAAFKMHAPRNSCSVQEISGENNTTGNGLVAELLQPELNTDPLPYELDNLKSQKKKKKRIRH